VNRVRVFLTLLAALVVALVVSTLPHLLDDFEVFEVDDYRLEGANYLTLSEAVAAAGVPSGASIWDDREPWEHGLESHPLVRDAEIGRRPPGTLVFRVRERTPVALVPSPTLEPVDASGARLPIDPAAHRLDLPVIRPWGGMDGTELTPEQLRALAHDVYRLSEADPQFFGLLSDVARDARGDVVIQAGDPAVTFRYRPPLNMPRLREGLLVLDDVLRRSGQAPAAIDLRYTDQVVVGLRRP
jgi:cell division septal protein FtsQ